MARRCRRTSPISRSDPPAPSIAVAAECRRRCAWIVPSPARRPAAATTVVTLVALSARRGACAVMNTARHSTLPGLPSRR